jgi:hypothetical protein
MSFKRITVAAIAALCVSSLPAWASSNPWSGAWQLDRVKSAPPGASFIISKNDDGSYQMKAPNQNYKFRCDGGDYVIRGVNSMGCKESGNQMDLFYKDEGAQSSRIHRVLSKDGKTITSETVLHSMPNSAPDNSSTAHGLSASQLKTQIYERMGEGEGFVGSWKEDAQNDGTGPILETTLKSSTFEVNYTERHQDTTMPLNGKDVPLKGTVTMSVQAGDAHTMNLMMKNSGQPAIQGTMTISDDGKTLTEDWWRPDHPEQKQHKVYNRI